MSDRRRAWPRFLFYLLQPVRLTACSADDFVMRTAHRVLWSVFRFSKNAFCIASAWFAWFLRHGSTLMKFGDTLPGLTWIQENLCIYCGIKTKHINEKLNYKSIFTKNKTQLSGHEMPWFSKIAFFWMILILPLSSIAILERTYKNCNYFI